MKDLFYKYYYLTKPGIVFGNVLTVIAGYFFASKWQINIKDFLAVIIGSSLIIASAGVINNIIDRKIDKKMKRTSKRALVLGDISFKNALRYGIILAVIGFYVLTLTNYKVELVGLVGYLDYLVLYSFFKRRSVYGTLIGSVSGSIPLVAGYLAYANKFDLIFLDLFLIMSVWQMAHFYAIAIYRQKDYSSAKLPMLPLIKGIFKTKVQISLYIILYLILNIWLYFIAKTSIIYLILMALISLTWVIKSLRGFNMNDDVLWAKDVFRFSLIVMISFSILLSIARII